MNGLNRKERRQVSRTLTKANLTVTELSLTCNGLEAPCSESVSVPLVLMVDTTLLRNNLKKWGWTLVADGKTRVIPLCPDCFTASQTDEKTEEKS